MFLMTEEGARSEARRRREVDRAAYQNLNARGRLSKARLRLAV